jgi:hypothetical protein
VIVLAVICSSLNLYTKLVLVRYAILNCGTKVTWHVEYSSLSRFIPKIFLVNCWLLNIWFDFSSR